MYYILLHCSIINGLPSVVTVLARANM